VIVSTQIYKSWLRANGPEGWIDDLRIEADKLAAENKVLRDALGDAATSLETVSVLAGRKYYGNTPIESNMDTFSDVRGYAASRASVAREALQGANHE